MARGTKIPIDLNRLNFVPISDVPEKTYITPWPELFKRIPSGQALALQENQVSPETVRAALDRFHQRKEFMNLEIRTRGSKGKRTVYVINTEKKPDARRT